MRSYVSNYWKCPVCKHTYPATEAQRNRHLWEHLRRDHPSCPVSELVDGFELHPKDLIENMAFVLGCTVNELVAAAAGRSTQWPADQFTGTRNHYRHLRDAIALAAGEWPWSTPVPYVLDMLRASHEERAADWTKWHQIEQAKLTTPAATSGAQGD